MEALQQFTLALQVRIEALYEERSLVEKGHMDKDGHMVIGVDFDYTLVHHDKLLPGAKEAMQKLHDAGHAILIHSCNNSEWIRLVLNNNDVPYDDVWEGRGKPVCDWYIDDRGINFGGNWITTLKFLGIFPE